MKSKLEKYSTFCNEAIEDTYIKVWGHHLGAHFWSKFPHGRIKLSELSGDNIRLLDKFLEDEPVKVLITEEGGVIQSVSANTDNIRVVTISYDDESDDPVSVTERDVDVFETEYFSESFESHNDDERFAMNQLNELNF